MMEIIIKPSIKIAFKPNGHAGADKVFSSIDLPTGINQFIDVISTRKDTNIIEPKIEMSPFRYRNLFSEHGAFRYTIQVSGQEIKPKFIRFLFEWHGQWDDFKVELDTTPFPQQTYLERILKRIKNFLCGQRLPNKKS
jgi:hypothetical protein